MLLKFKSLFLKICKYKHLTNSVINNFQIEIF